mmetsp:Transcript_17798/g.24871  ORF Transcript_17798/g.24871 Transcript_17798/m.24871 type:complete len:235 (-) Transcript_17798:718-1422(-)
MEGGVLEQFERVRDLVLAVRRLSDGVRGPHIVQESRCHDRVSGFLVKNLEGLEVRDSAVSPLERDLVHHARSRGGRSDVGRHRNAAFIRDDCAPVLESLRQGVVGALVDNQAVHEGMAACAPHVSFEPLLRYEAHSSFNDRAKRLEQEGVEVRLRRIRCLARDNVHVGRGAQEGECRHSFRSAVRHSFHDGVRTYGKLDVKSTIEVGIVADDDVVLWVLNFLKIQQPVFEVSWV